MAKKDIERILPDISSLDYFFGLLLRITFRLELVEIGLIGACDKIDMPRAGLLAFNAERILSCKTSEAEIVMIVSCGANQRFD